MRLQICLHKNFFDRNNHFQMVPQEAEEEEEEQLSSFIELAKINLSEFKNITPTVQLSFQF